MSNTDWFANLKTRIAGTPESRIEYESNSSILLENHQTGRMTKSKIEILACAIDELLSYQEYRMKLKEQRKQEAMRRRYRNKFVENKDVL